MNDLTQVNPVGKQLVYESFVHQPPMAHVALAADIGLATQTFRPRFLCDGGNGAQADESLEQEAHALRLFFIDLQSAVDNVISQWRRATHPHALTLARRQLVAYALTGDFAFELREGQQHVKRQPAHGSGGVELLRHRDK